MFFRRERPIAPSFSDRLAQLQSAGFRVENLASGKARIHRDGLAADLLEKGDSKVQIGEVGLAIGNEIAVLTDVGYQKIFITPSGKKTAALAEHLKALHAFAEDVRERIGLVSLYNESLGTTNEQHLYDRVENRDKGVPRRPWQR